MVTDLQNLYFLLISNIKKNILSFRIEEIIIRNKKRELVSFDLVL